MLDFHKKNTRNHFLVESQQTHMNYPINLPSNSSKNLSIVNQVIKKRKSLRFAQKVILLLPQYYYNL